jgi:type I restriction enzyme S subunit
VVELGAVGNVQGGFAFKSKDYSKKGIPLVKIANVHTGTLRWDETSFVPETYLFKHKDFALQKGDLVIALTRPIIKSLDSVKIVSVQDKDLPCLLNQRVGRFQMDSLRVNSAFLLGLVQTQYFKNEIEKFASTSLQPNVSTKQIEKIQIPLPPLPLQTRFAAMVANIEAQRRLAERQLEAAEAVFGGVLQGTFER